MRRQIIKIDEDKCDGCGLCVPNCPEGALQMVDGKAKMVSEIFCDGLGACIGHCPQGAITIEERDVEEYREELVIERIAQLGDEEVKAHLTHLQEHGQREYLEEAIAYMVENELDVPKEFMSVAVGLKGRTEKASRETPSPNHRSEGKTAESPPAGCPSQGCPGARVITYEEDEEDDSRGDPDVGRPSRLRQWPVQIHLVPPHAPYLKGADLLVAADCVPFAYADFHDDLLRSRVLLVGCPKLDDAKAYVEKLTQVFKLNDIRSVVVARMEVPCCSGLRRIVDMALEASGRDIPVEDVTIGIGGDRLAM